MAQQARIAVFIGRFQPFHAGHRHVLTSVAGEVDHILVLVGSSYRPRSWKNPFTYHERKGFIEAGAHDLAVPVDVLPLIDTLYNDRAWGTNVRTAVSLYLRRLGIAEDEAEIVLTGFEKDASSRYLGWFPEWTMRPCTPHVHEGRPIHATDLREGLFFPDDEFGRIALRFGNREVAQVTEWVKANGRAVEAIQAEGAFIRSYRARTLAAEKVFGHPIPINTADAVVVQSGHVLLVRRGLQPGKGTYALPGGHLERSESSFQAAMRELREETRLDVPPRLLANRARGSRVFDHPDRSERGWVRTEAFFFEFEDKGALERVKGGDDAAAAAWYPISEIVPDQLFEDHFDIVQHFVPEVTASYPSILMAHVGALS